MTQVLQRQIRSRSSRFFAYLVPTFVLLLVSSVAAAQPFGRWATFHANPDQYVEVPNAADLNPPTALTIEAWVSTYPRPRGCRAIIGKNFQTSYSVGICTPAQGLFPMPLLTSRLRGVVRTGGILPRSFEWNHIAVTYDGAQRIHYINGEQVAVFFETGPLPSNSDSLRIGSDGSTDFQEDGSIDEVRFWNYARSAEQIRGSINVPIITPQPGLIAVWNMEPDLRDVVGGHNGTNVGGVSLQTRPVALDCGTGSATSACLNTRFLVSVQFGYPTTPGFYDVGKVVDCQNPNSAVFWFFAPNAWEVLTKVVDGCSFNDRFWFFSAATTNVFYRLEVVDVRAGETKIYFNYPGPPAPAVTDTAAFQTCTGVGP